MIKFYNSLTNKKEEFKPVEDGLVRMYTCGPTVYYYQHIGNMRAYIFMDSLRRTLKYNGYKINGVMNVTDVGHLTSDEDSGEDKMEKAAKRENKSPYEIAKFYADIYFKDLALLNIDKPEHITYATEYIPQMIEFVKKLEEKGYTYRIDDGIYFDVKKFKDYGQLSEKDLDKVGNARIEENSQKHHPFDFALWKFVPENHIMKWDSPWGVGCPGWHIECSAMSNHILGEYIDIHTGGIDHKTIHHEDEIAQNDAMTGHKVVNTWMHNEFLLVDGGKMSKSLNNIYTIANLVERGFEPLAFKYFCLNTSYTKEINFTFDALKASQSALKNLRKSLSEHKNGENVIAQEVLKKYEDDFLNAINDNLNTPLALGILFSLVKEPKSKQVYELAIKFDQAFGLDLDKEEEISVPDNVKELAELRWQAKKEKNWAVADKYREEILNLGYVIKDSAQNYTIEKK